MGVKPAYVGVCIKHAIQNIWIPLSGPCSNTVFQIEVGVDSAVRTGIASSLLSQSRKAPVIIFSLTVVHSLPVNSLLFLSKFGPENQLLKKKNLKILEQATYSLGLTPDCCLRNEKREGSGILIWMPFSQRREKSALKQDHAALKFIGNNSGNVAK